MQHLPCIPLTAQLCCSTTADTHVSQNTPPVGLQVAVVLTEKNSIAVHREGCPGH